MVKVRAGPPRSKGMTDVLPRCHWYPNGGVPAIWTWNETVSPWTVVWASGWRRKLGGEIPSRIWAVRARSKLKSELFTLAW